MKKIIPCTIYMRTITGALTDVTQIAFCVCVLHLFVINDDDDDDDYDLVYVYLALHTVACGPVLIISVVV